MNNILIIAKKEWLAYVLNPVGYVFSGLLMIISGWLFFGDFFLLGQADLLPYWATIVFLFSIFIPAISMGLLADEKRNGNWEVLLTLPTDETEVILGKYAGAVGFLIFSLMFTIPTIITVMLLGKPDIGLIISGFLGTFFLGAAYLATGIAASSLSNQPIVDFLLASVFLIINNLFSQEVFLSRLPAWWQGIFENLSLTFRMTGFSEGVVRLSDLVFVVSWIIIFLLVSILILKSKNK